MNAQCMLAEAPLLGRTHFGWILDGPRRFWFWTLIVLVVGASVERGQAQQSSLTRVVRGQIKSVSGRTIRIIAEQPAFQVAKGQEVEVALEGQTTIVTLGDIPAPVSALRDYRRAVVTYTSGPDGNRAKKIVLYEPVNGSSDRANFFATEAEAQSHFQRGLELQNRGDLEGAIREYRNGISLSPNIASAHNNLGNALDDQGKHEEAIGEYREAMRLDPSYGMARQNLASALQREGKDQNRASIETPIGEGSEGTSCKNFTIILNASGGGAGGARDLARAIGQLHNMLQSNPTSACANELLCDEFVVNGGYAEGVPACRAALRFQRDSNRKAAVSDNLGVALDRTGEVEAAIEAFRAAIRLRPSNFDAHSNLADALLKSRRYDEAVPEYRIVVRLNPRDAEGHEFLGMALEKTGQKDAAIAEYRTAIRLDPSKAWLLEDPKR